MRRELKWVLRDDKNNASRASRVSKTARVICQVLPGTSVMFAVVVTIDGSVSRPVRSGVE